MENTYTATILGASGLVGGLLLTRLLADEDCKKVVVLLRKPLTLGHDKLEQVIVDFEHLDDYRGYFANDYIFCCLGTTLKKAGSKQAFRKIDFELCMACAQLARDMSAKKFLLISSLGANADSNSFYLRTKGELENAVYKLGLAKFYIVRPSLLIGERTADFRPGEAMGIAVAKLLLPFALVFVPNKWKKYLPVPAPLVAETLHYLATDKKPELRVEFQA